MQGSALLRVCGKAFRRLAPEDALSTLIRWLIKYVLSIVLRLENSSSPFSDPVGVSSLEKPSGIVPVRSSLWCPNRRCALSRPQELVPALGRSRALAPKALLESQLCPSCCVTQEKHSPLSLSLLFCKMGTNIPPGQVRPTEGWRRGLPGCDPWMQGQRLVL